MQELHKLLFYLVYGYEGDCSINQEEAWQSIKTSSPEIKEVFEDSNEYPPLYLSELNWK